MNKKGFAVSGVVYSVLILFLILIFGVIGILSSRKIVLDKMKNSVISELNGEELVNIYIDDSGANYPKLVDKMIPVIYDETKSKWIYADIYEKWYDYDEKMWANAVILKTGVVKTVGQEIEEDEIALMYVWIPRFKYVIFNAYGEQMEEQQIEIIFENGVSSTGTVKCVDAINQKNENGNVISEICTDITNDTIVNNASTYTHPAFTFGEEEIEGFWVGKFENSTTDSKCIENVNPANCNHNNHVIEIKGNTSALRQIEQYNMFLSIRNISDNYGINNADSHMIKNMEWGAVAYLTASKYGQSTTEVRKNNNSNYITGCGAKEHNGAAIANCEIQYLKVTSYPQSTTGNIYGVFDMNGGSWEQSMGIMAGLDGNISSDTGLSSYMGIERKYYDLYSYSESSQDRTKFLLGEASKETQGWNDDFTETVFSTEVWHGRGGANTAATISGVFYISSIPKGKNTSHSSRSILIKE